MSIKTTLTKTVRKVLPANAISGVENMYRTSRANLISARYGHPARQLKVIAITGTNGKTTTANYLNAILKTAGKTTSMFSTANIEIAGQQRPNDMNLTVPPVATLQKFFRDSVKAGVEYCIIEAVSQGLHQKKLLNIPIHMAIMTNLTEDHLDYHKSMDNYAAAKAILFQMKPNYIVLNHDDSRFEYFDAYPATDAKVTYGRDKSSTYHITQSKLYKRGVEATIIHDKTKYDLATHIPGEFNIYNMAAATAAAATLGITSTDIEDGIASIQGISGRYEILDLDAPYTVVVDYAHTPDGLERLLKSAQETTKGRVILIFGSMGAGRDKAKRPKMGIIAEKNADIIFVTDEENDKESRAAIRADILAPIKDSKKVTEVDGRREAIEVALETARTGDTVLITGLGHETYRLLDGQRVKWSDQDIVRQILGE
jgi:UDP-N-acetylmuramoyl-L-alanyl-D-glutamate--2,6-diaminopimelate ligase